MTFFELKELCKRITYHREHFQVVPYEPFTRYPTDPLCRVEIGFLVKDVNPPHRTNMIRENLVFDMEKLRRTPPEIVLRDIYNAVVRMEEHEVREWLQFDGNFIVEPHPELAQVNAYRYAQAQMEKNRG